MKKLISPSISDKPMWDIWMSRYHLAVVSVADELNLFGAINTNKLNVSQIADRVGVLPRSIELISEILTILGFLNKKNGVYSLSQTSKTYLMPSSQFYWGALLESFRKIEEHQKILNAIKLGSNQLLYENKTFTDMWKEGSLTLEAASFFTKKMHATIFAPATIAIEKGVFKSTKNLLDVGGGSGCFSIAFLKRYPKHKATIFELPVVCEIARQYIEEYNLSNKIITHAGNFFNSKMWPTGHDGVLLSQILHDWPEEYCKKILKNSYDSLSDGGTIYIHEMLLDERKSPLAVSCFDLLMFINHKSQQFTKKKIFELLKLAGFKNCKIKKTFGYYSVIYAKK